MTGFWVPAIFLGLYVHIFVMSLRGCDAQRFTDNVLQFATDALSSEDNRVHLTIIHDHTVWLVGCTSVSHTDIRPASFTLSYLVERFWITLNLKYFFNEQAVMELVLLTQKYALVL